MKTIKTDRLLLRELSLADLDTFYEISRMKEVADNAGFNVHESLAESEFILNDLILAKTTYAIELIEEHHFIGSISFYLTKEMQTVYEEKSAEIGYSLSSSHWNKGYGSEVVNALIDNIFSSMDEIEYIKAYAFVDNLRSMKLLEKLHFKKIKIEKLPLYEKELIYYKLARKDWLDNGN